MPHRAHLAQGTLLGPEQLSTLLDSVQELLAILSPDGIIQYASAGFTHVLGHNTESLAGRSIVDLVHASDAAAAREARTGAGAGSRLRQAITPICLGSKALSSVFGTSPIFIAWKRSVRSSPRSCTRSTKPPT